jgi:hypothetical protein
MVEEQANRHDARVGDEDLRERERRHESSGSLEDEARLLMARARAGDLPSGALEVAAAVGHPAAMRALGVDTPALGNWLLDVARLGRRIGDAIERWGPGKTGQQATGSELVGRPAVGMRVARAVGWAIEPGWATDNCFAGEDGLTPLHLLRALDDWLVDPSTASRLRHMASRLRASSAPFFLFEDVITAGLIPGAAPALTLALTRTVGLVMADELMDEDELVSAVCDELLPWAVGNL